jgi:hypothetical protein
MKILISYAINIQIFHQGNSSHNRKGIRETGTSRYSF